MPVTAYRGDAAGLGWDITSGTWYTGPGQVVVNTAVPAPPAWPPARTFA